MARTQEQRKADTRARLLVAAADQFAAHGYHGVSTDALADAADRTSGAVYAHFGGKEGLLLALLDAWEGAAAAEITDSLEGTHDLAGRLGAIWATFSSPPGDEGRSWMLLEHELWLFAARNPDAASRLAARYGDARAGMAEAFETWTADEPAELPAAPEGLATLVLALLFGLEMQRRVDPAAVPDGLALAGLRTLFGLDSSAAGGRPDSRRITSATR